MLNLLNKLAIKFSLLGVDGDYEADWSWVPKLVTVIKSVLVPVLSVVGAAGTIYAIVIAVQMARADNGEKREEAKKRLISVIVAIAVLVILIVFFLWLFPLILKQMLPGDFEWEKYGM